MLVPGTLCPALERATQRALACGALRPIETVQQTIEDGGIEFVIRSVSSLARKALAQARGMPGATAGASQPHKHLQMIPLPLGTGGASTPIDEALSVVRDRRGILTAPGLPFRHSFACERFEGVAINALGFAGSLFVRDDGQLETIKRLGPMTALRAVSGIVGEEPHDLA